MNKFKKASGLSALALVLLSCLVPFNAAIAAPGASGIVNAEVCDLVLSAKEKEKGKDAEEEPDCE